jgi:hypothetical protein
MWKFAAVGVPPMKSTRRRIAERRIQIHHPVQAVDGDVAASATDIVDIGTDRVVTAAAAAPVIAAPVSAAPVSAAPVSAAPVSVTPTVIAALAIALGAGVDDVGAALVDDERSVAGVRTVRSDDAGSGKIERIAGAGIGNGVEAIAHGSPVVVADQRHGHGAVAERHLIVEPDETDLIGPASENDLVEAGRAADGNGSNVVAPGQRVVVAQQQIHAAGVGRRTAGSDLMEQAGIGVVPGLDFGIDLLDQLPR